MSMMVFEHEVILYDDDNREYIDNSWNLENKTVCSNSIAKKYPAYDRG